MNKMHDSYDEVGFDQQTELYLEIRKLGFTSGAQTIEIVDSILGLGYVRGPGWGELDGRSKPKWYAEESFRKAAVLVGAALFGVAVGILAGATLASLMPVRTL